MTLNKNLKFIPPLFVLLSVVSSWALANWPGTFSPDSLDSLNQVRTGQYTDWSPISFQIYLYLLTFGGKYIYLIFLFQFLMAIAAIGALLRFIVPRIKTVTVLYLTALILMLPIVGQMSMQVWKDVPYSYLTIIGLCHFFNSLVNQNKRGQIFSVITLALASSFRHEGFVVLLFFTIVILFLSVRNKKQAQFGIVSKRRITAYLLVMLGISMILPKVLFMITSASPAPNWLNSISFQQDLAVIAKKSPGSLSSDTFKKVISVSSGESLLGALKCEKPDYMIWNDGFNRVEFEKISSEIKILWLNALPSNWQKIASRRICASASYAPPLMFGSINPISMDDLWRAEWMGWGIYEPIGNQMGIKTSPKNEFLENWMLLWAQAFGRYGGIIGWPGLHLALIFVIFLFQSPKKSLKTKIGFLLFFLSCRHIVLGLMAAGPIYRYAFITHVVSVTLIVATIYEFLRNISSKKTLVFKKLRGGFLESSNK